MSGRGRIYKPRPNGPYFVDYYAAGRRIRQRVGYDREKAEKFLKRKLAEETLRHRGARGHATNAVPLGVVRDAWLEQVHLTCRPRTAGYYEHVIGQILSRLPCRTVLQITPALVNSYATARLREDVPLAERTLNMQIGALKTMLKWAAETRLIESNPLLGLKPLKLGARKYRRAMTEQEVNLLLSQSPFCYRRIWMFMLGTGFRRGEVQALRWSDLDLDRDDVHIPAERSKNAAAATVPLPPPVADMLRQLKRENRGRSEHVFLNQAGRPWTVNLLRKLRSCLHQVGIPGSQDRPARKELDAYWEGVDLHALRVTYITHLVRAGVDIKTVQRLARHKTIAMTLDVYARTFPQDQRAAAGKLPYFGQHAGNKTRQRDSNVVAR